MAERVQEVEETTVNNGVPAESTRKVTTVSGDRVAAGDSTGERLVGFIAGALMILLAFRFILSLLGANRGNAFADFIYSLSYPFVAPFFGLFGYTMRYGVSRFEIETLVAMLVYAVVAFGIVQLIRIARKEPS